MPRGSIEQLLADRIGLDAESLGPRLIDRAIERRSRARGLATPADYLRCLKSEPDEIQHLVEEIVVPETWFFRDERPFTVLLHYLKEFSLPRAGIPLRVLSLPCSSGEEPYSLAMCLLELGYLPPAFHIDAIDISLQTLDRARKAVYTPHSCRALSEERRARFFLPHPQGIELKPLVRDAVHFQHGNLMDTRPLSRGQPYQIIFCRNLLIYLNPAARQKAFANLDCLLAPGGLLYLGHAETPAGDTSQYRPYPAQGRSAFLKSPDPTRSSDSSRKSPEPPGAVPPPPALPRPRAAAKPALAPPRISSAAKKPPAASPQPPQPVNLLEQAEQLANSQQYAQAISRVEQFLESSGSSARAYHLLGMIHQAEGRADRAEEFLARAVYLDSSDIEALLTLALLARRRGDLATASRYDRLSQRARKKETPSS